MLRFHPDAPAYHCTFSRQSFGKAAGLAIARKGAQFLIAYHLQDGQLRQRWISGLSVFSLAGNAHRLPRYVARTCPAYSVDHVAYPEVRNVDVVCPHCFGFHKHLIEDGSLVGFRSFKLPDRLVFDGAPFNPGAKQTAGDL